MSITINLNVSYADDNKNFGNYYPHLCDFDINVGIENRPWNLEHWKLKYDIVDKNNEEFKHLLTLVTKNDVVLKFSICKNEKTISKGYTIYNMHTGKIVVFKNDSGDECSIKSFIAHTLDVFDGINYIEFTNAMNQGCAKLTKKNHGRIDNVSYDFNDEDNLETQNARQTITPRIKQAHQTIDIDESEGEDKPHRTIKHATYKKRMWQRRSYYRRDGTFVKACICKRRKQHTVTK